MQSSLERIDKNLVALEVGLDTDEVEQALEAAYRRVVRKLKVPGFRHGKVPRPILEAHWGKEILYKDAIDILLSDGYREAIEEHALTPIDRPELSIIEPLAQGKPFVFKVEVGVLPAVSLGKYTGVKVPKPELGVNEEDIDRRLEALRVEHAELVLAGREELAAGDFAVVDFNGYVDGHPFRGGAAESYTIEMGGGGYLPGFTEGLMGMHPGETREIAVVLPADHTDRDLAGKEARFSVVLREIKVKEIPPLDGEFAKSLGHESVASLREHVRTVLQDANERESGRIFARHVVERVVADARIDIPPVLVDRQVEEQYQAVARNLVYQGLTIDEYLAKRGKTEDEIKNEMRPEAEVVVRTDLVLDAVRKTEKLEPTEEEVEQRIAELSALTRGKPPYELRKEMERSGRLAALKDGLAREQTIKFLADKAEPVSEERAGKN